MVQIPSDAVSFRLDAYVSNSTVGNYSSIAADVLGKEEMIQTNPPVAIKDRGISVVTGQSVVFYPLNNDYDPDGDTMTVTRTWQVDTPNSSTINLDGSITFTAGNGYIGGDYFYYEITDGNNGFDTASVIVEVVSP